MSFDTGACYQYKKERFQWTENELYAWNNENWDKNNKARNEKRKHTTFNRLSMLSNCVVSNAHWFGFSNPIPI